MATKNNKKIMTKEEIITKLKDIATPYVLNKSLLDSYSENTDFIKDLEINSANLVDIILDVEDEFGVEINDEAMDGMLTVNDAVAVIQKELAK